MRTARRPLKWIKTIDGETWGEIDRRSRMATKAGARQGQPERQEIVETMDNNNNNGNNERLVLFCSLFFTSRSGLNEYDELVKDSRWCCHSANYRAHAQHEFSKTISPLLEVYSNRTQFVMEIYSWRFFTATHAKETLFRGRWTLSYAVLVRRQSGIFQSSERSRNDFEKVLMDGVGR